MRWDDDRAREHVARIETLLSALDAITDEAARARAVETVQALIDLYGECLGRIMDRLAGTETAEACAEDELVGHVLLVHDLHPLPAEQRIRRALEQAGRRDVELVGVEGRVARVRLPEGGACCGSGTAAVEGILAVAAPEIERVDAIQPEPASRRTLIPVEALLTPLRGGAGNTP
ncbi:NifU family protein [Streptomyces sp. NPDC002577]